jgi:light-regulated signal transduction histidine kinase (bacteriophytochrome)
MNRARIHEQQSPEVSRLIPSISHDLKEPLRALRCHAELLAEKLKSGSDPEITSLLTYITDAAERLQRMVDDATAFALVEASLAERRRVDMEEALLFALANLEACIAERKAVITADPMPNALANFEALARVFQNLIANGIKYSKKRPRIHVGCVKRGAECTLSVADHGIGIDPEYYEMVFQPFKRLHSHKEYPGTGLGLAICRRVVESNGGRIWVESTPGEGSTFYFTVPAARGATSAGFDRRGAGMRHGPVKST